MADEKVIGGGVGSWNTGDTGINDGTAGVGDSADGGGGGTTGQPTTGTTNSTSGTSGTGGTSGSSAIGTMTDAELVQSVVTKYLALSGIGLTYKQFVPIYVDNKLGFAKLKEEYKKANPDMDPKEIDAAVDEEKQAVIKEFDPDDGTTASKDELEAKFNEFKSSVAKIKKDLGSIASEFAKTIGEAFMPTTIGLGAPNPLSITLKLFNGITKIKKILDSVFAALSVFMLSAKALGLDETDGYNEIMTAVATPLRVIQDLISKQESDPSYQEDVALATYLEEAKKNWPYGQANDIDYTTVEGWGRDGITYSGGGTNQNLVISIWPIEDPKDRQQLVSLIGAYNRYNTQLPSGVGIYDGLIFKMETMLKYNDYLGWLIKEFRKNYNTLADSNQNNNSTDIPSYEELSSSGTSGSSGSSGSSGGGNNNNTGNFIQKFTRALFKRING